MLKSYVTNVEYGIHSSSLAVGVGSYFLPYSDGLQP